MASDTTELACNSAAMAALVLRRLTSIIARPKPVGSLRFSFLNCLGLASGLWRFDGLWLNDGYFGV